MDVVKIVIPVLLYTVTDMLRDYTRNKLYAQFRMYSRYESGKGIVASRRIGSAYTGDFSQRELANSDI